MSEKVTALRIFVCGAEDVVENFDRLARSVVGFNSSTSQFTGVVLEPNYWTAKPTGPTAQDEFERQLALADVALFVLYRRLGTITEQEFNQAVTAFREHNSPEVRVWFEYVPREVASDPGEDYARLLKFREHVRKNVSEVFACPTFRSERRIAAMFGDNSELPTLDALCLQELYPVVLRMLGQREAVVTDETRISVPDAITRDMRKEHWRGRAAREGLLAVTTPRYGKRTPDLAEESRKFVDFVLERASPFLQDQTVIEIGSGIGRFTLPLVDIAKSLTTLDMCEEMTQKLNAALGQRRSEVKHFEAFVEDFDAHGEVWDTALVCLVLIHILNEEDLRRAVRNIKLCACNVVLCEHTDVAAQSAASNFTRIWSREELVALFGSDYTLHAEHKCSFFGDKLELFIFRRDTRFICDGSVGYLAGHRRDVLIDASERSEASLPMNWDDWYTPFGMERLRFAYEALIGSETPREWVFALSDVTVVRSQDTVWTPPKEVGSGWAERTNAAMRKVREKGDYEVRREEKARIDAVFPRHVDPLSGVPRRLEIHLSRVEYYDYVVTNDLLNESGSGFRATHTARHNLTPETIGSLVTTNIGGCGVFVRTIDGFVVLSLRRMVAQYPGLVGYSASGSMNWWLSADEDTPEANPFLTAMRETHEELGIALHSDDLRLFAVGMDLGGFFVQFSFVVDLPMSAREFLAARKRATARYEQDVFALPWRVEEVVAVVTRYVMEPSAGATLLQLACQSFGEQEVKERIQDAL